MYASGKTQGWYKNKDLAAGHYDSVSTEIQSSKVIHLTNCIMYTKRTCIEICDFNACDYKKTASEIILTR